MSRDILVSTPDLLQGECHLWLIEPDSLMSLLPAFRPLLSQAELARASAFHAKVDAIHYLIRTGLLRTLLGRYCGLPAGELPIGSSANGKPHMPGIEFNVSHTRRFSLFAFSRHQRVGVDIELIRPIHDFPAAAGRVLTPDEKARMDQLEAGLKNRAFFRAWTCKEAVVKAAGKRLADALNSFSVDITPGRPAAILDRDVARLWTLYDAVVPDGWCAALAADTPYLTIRNHEISYTDRTSLY